jgi:uncharacterized membrane protein YphA (DoxX/SURF4 family)
VRYFVAALRVALALVFLYAAYTKLRQPWLLFAMSIDAYQILPEWAAMSLGRIIPWLELALGLLLATGFALRYSAAGASILLGVFFAVMVRSYSMGMKIDCACFGLGEAIGPGTLARDGALLALSVGLTVLAVKRTGLKGTDPLTVAVR